MILPVRTCHWGNMEEQDTGIRNEILHLVRVGRIHGHFLLACYLVFVDYNVWIFAILTLFYSSIITTFTGNA